MSTYDYDNKYGGEALGVLYAWLKGIKELDLE